MFTFKSTVCPVSVMLSKVTMWSIEGSVLSIYDGGAQPVKVYFKDLASAQSEFALFEAEMKNLKA